MKVAFDIKETSLMVSGTELLMINKALGLMAENEEVHVLDRKLARLMLKEIRENIGRKKNVG